MTRMSDKVIARFHDVSFTLWRICHPVTDDSMQTKLHYPWKCVSSFPGPRPRCLSFREEGRRRGDNRGKSIKDHFSKTRHETSVNGRSHTCTRIVDNDELK